MLGGSWVCTLLPEIRAHIQLQEDEDRSLEVELVLDQLKMLTINFLDRTMLHQLEGEITL
jgi:hypothetical protein